ncbi:hypothetical protein [Candidatus Liberibacter americanus]|uniref:Uncharacterized protein n=1 Tax=Candidatus Liberibacter americanus str. Sao Paulo TaxID=1261131 RepID=U6B5A8_9HYPH|nr:hypothetical protein [Candidatus Liberibacter americanus]AHA28100.1 hypothetical protein lam_757 [Candidatus Liberibacter americanus str. Sao Paulo]EMS36053.1 hypothetical protein G653_03631 [Candidatus Liberibacter americanus PW_SP]
MSNYEIFFHLCSVVYIVYNEIRNRHTFSQVFDRVCDHFRSSRVYLITDVKSKESSSPDNASASVIKEEYRDPAVRYKFITNSKDP